MQVPLVLWDADYGADVVPFRRSHIQLEKTRRLLRDDIHQHLSQLFVMHHLYAQLLSTSHDGPLYEPHPNATAHVPLRRRQCEPSFAERMEKHTQRFGLL